MTIQSFSELDLEGINTTANEDGNGTVLQSKSGRFKPEVCKFLDKDGNEQFFTVQGILSTAIARPAELKPNGEVKKKAYHDLEIRLTKKTYAVGSSDNSLALYDEGDTILIAATAALKKYVEIALREKPEKVYELKFIPVGKKQVAGTAQDPTEMWEYEVRLIAAHDPNKVITAAAMLAERQLEAAMTAPALPSA